MSRAVNKMNGIVEEVIDVVFDEPVIRIERLICKETEKTNLSGTQIETLHIYRPKRPAG